MSISVIPGRWQRKRRVGTVVSSDPYRDHYTFGMPDREKPVFPRRRRLVVHLSSSEALAPSGAVRPGRRQAGPYRGPPKFARKPRNHKIARAFRVQCIPLGQGEGPTMALRTDLTAGLISVAFAIGSVPAVLAQTRGDGRRPAHRRRASEPRNDLRPTRSERCTRAVASSPQRTPSASSSSGRTSASPAISSPTSGAALRRAAGRRSARDIRAAAALAGLAFAQRLLPDLGTESLQTCMGLSLSSGVFRFIASSLFGG